jgi:copper transport protein
MGTQFLRWSLLLLLANVTLPGVALAHIRVTSSVPAAGSTSADAVRMVRVTFSQRVEPRYTNIRVLDASGTEVALAGVQPADSTFREYVATLAAPLPNGSYTIAWRAAGPDGHVVSGEFPIVVRIEALDTASVIVVAPPDPGTMGEPLTEYDPNARPVAVVVRWFNLLAVLLGIGAVVFRTVILPGSNFESAPERFWAELHEGLRRMGVLSGVLVLAAALPRFLLQSAALHGRELMFDASNVNALLFGTAWGVGWVVQVVAGAGLLIAANQHSRALAVIAALALALTPAFSGHAVAVEGVPALAVASDALHVLGAATWLGSLAMIVVIAVPIAFRQGESAYAGLAATVRAYSPIALVAATAILLSGVATALLHITTFSQLWTGSYGRALLIKLGLVAVVAGLGFHNWRRVRPRLGTEASSRHLRNSARLELIAALLVVLVTAVLIALPTPR